mmetsp:Transcript_8693/g.28653  ORF Transcript_8693/g.28653 Transcript_8693/m.28653 type:complete len:303 (+) Transcript_8693:1330-2238(+)
MLSTSSRRPAMRPSAAWSCAPRLLTIAARPESSPWITTCAGGGAEGKEDCSSRLVRSDMFALFSSRPPIAGRMLSSTSFRSCSICLRRLSSSVATAEAAAVVVSIRCGAGGLGAPAAGAPAAGALAATSSTLSLTLPMLASVLSARVATSVLSALVPSISLRSLASPPPPPSPGEACCGPAASSAMTRTVRSARSLPSALSAISVESLPSSAFRSCLVFPAKVSNRSSALFALMSSSATLAFRAETLISLFFDKFSSASILVLCPSTEPLIVTCSASRASLDRTRSALVFSMPSTISDCFFL